MCCWCFRRPWGPPVWCVRNCADYTRVPGLSLPAELTLLKRRTERPPGLFSHADFSIPGHGNHRGGPGTIVLAVNERRRQKTLGIDTNAGVWQLRSEERRVGKECTPRWYTHRSEQMMCAYRNGR